MGLGQFADLRGGGGGAWEERGGSVFEDVVYITAVKEK